MKKNNSFKTTFYLGLIVLTVITSILMLIGYNIFRAVTPKFKKDKLEIYIEDVKPEKEIVHDTIYVDKPRVKVDDSPKNVTVVKLKSAPVVLEKIDTTIILDTVK
jgi:hypothetical protein